LESLLASVGNAACTHLDNTSTFGSRDATDTVLWNVRMQIRPAVLKQFQDLICALEGDALTIYAVRFAPVLRMFDEHFCMEGKRRYLLSFMAWD